MAELKNVLGEPLQACCKFPMTGFYRDGYCRVGPDDHGVHSVCIEVTEEFLQFSKEAGNDLSTPMPQYDFPGLIAGDYWCLCAARWKEAYDAKSAPFVVLEATDQKTLEFVSLEVLKQYETKRSELR